MFVVKLLDRNERADALAERLNNQASLFPDKRGFIIYALKCAIGFCDFIIFECAIPDMYCQFDLTKNIFYMDMTTTPTNHIFPHLKKARRLLDKLGCSYSDEYPRYMEYRYDSGGDMHSLNANFGKNVELATDFTMRVFTEIYKDNTKEHKVILGNFPKPNPKKQS